MSLSKGGDIMILDMEEEINNAEIIKNEIARYMSLLRIERANNGHPNCELSNEITESRVTLEALGVNVEGLKLAG